MPLPSSPPITQQDVFDEAESCDYTGSNSLNNLIAYDRWVNLPANADRLSDFLGVFCNKSDVITRIGGLVTVEEDAVNVKIVKMTSSYFLLFYQVSDELYMSIYFVNSTSGLIVKQGTTKRVATGLDLNNTIEFDAVYMGLSGNSSYDYMIAYAYESGSQIYIGVLHVNITTTNIVNLFLSYLVDTSSDRINPFVCSLITSGTARTFVVAYTNTNRSSYWIRSVELSDDLVGSVTLGTLFSETESIYALETCDNNTSVLVYTADVINSDTFIKKLLFNDTTNSFTVSASYLLPADFSMNKRNNISLFTYNTGNEADLTVIKDGGIRTLTLDVDSEPLVQKSDIDMEGIYTPLRRLFGVRLQNNLSNIITYESAGVGSANKTVIALTYTDQLVGNGFKAEIIEVADTDEVLTRSIHVVNNNVFVMAWISDQKIKLRAYNVDYDAVSA